MRLNAHASTRGYASLEFDYSEHRANMRAGLALAQPIHVAFQQEGGG